MSKDDLVLFNDLIPISIEDEMKSSYLDYAMSVIKSRALPDVRDGLKPVHRRILFAMHESGFHHDKPYKKSARIVGEVMAKYHPHGESAIYDSLVRMAQNFSLMAPLIDGQGNFGSVDGDSAAAMRYTESRLSAVAENLINDLDKDTVTFSENYDGSEREPDVLPAEFPNLLVNGGGGIAVGMATNIPPHNLGEVIDATCLLIDNPHATIEEIMQHVKGPDFPTKGLIMGITGCRNFVSTGRGSIIMRGRATIDKIDNRNAIIITEIPYMVNKAKMIERIAELVRDKKIEGISDLRDESDKSGIRVVVELKRDATPDVILSQLYSYTPLQTSFGGNLLAINNGKPELMNVRTALSAFISFRETVITRRTIYLLNKAEARSHILLGLAVAVDNIDEVIALIRAAKDAAEAKEQLMARKWRANTIMGFVNASGSTSSVIIDNGMVYLTDAQAKAILEMRLARLTGLEQEKILGELGQLASEIGSLNLILAERSVLLKILRDELVVIKEKFAIPRQTEIVGQEFEQDIEELIPKQQMVVTVTLGGYIKRVLLDTYRSQRRGGKGRSAMSMNDDDIVTDFFIAGTHNYMLFFSNYGKVYRQKVYKLPLGSPQTKGKALVNFLSLGVEEKITNIMQLPEDQAEWEHLSIIFVTKLGCIRRSSLNDFRSIQSNGKIAISLEEGDSLVSVQLCSDRDHILLTTKLGMCLRFPVEKLRVIKSRKSVGVTAMKLKAQDEIISFSVIHTAEFDAEIRDKYLKIPAELRIKIKEAQKTEELNFLLSKINEEEIGLAAENIIKMAKNEEFLLSVTEKGMGKRTSAYEYRITNRGGVGVTNMNLTAKSGNIISCFMVNDEDQIMLITDKGMVLRNPVNQIRMAGRNTKGVIVFRVPDDEKIMSVARISDTGSMDDDNIDQIIDAPQLFEE